MPYNKNLEARIQKIVSSWKNTGNKKMFGGICHLLNGNMFCGVYKDFLILRLGEEEAREALELPFVKPFDITGKPMKGWVTVEEQGFTGDQGLKAWLEKARVSRKRWLKNKGRETAKALIHCQRRAAADMISGTTLKLFGQEIAKAKEFQFRPAYFPFTEPSVELHVKHPALGWMELGGAGLFRPEVTLPLGVDVPVIAWGLGLDRMAMIAMEIKDIRDLFSTDLDFVRTKKIQLHK